MPKRYVIPPETEKERFILGLTMAQLMWAGGGLALGFGGFMLWSTLTDSMFMALVFGAPIGLVVVPFIVYRPKEKSMTFMQYLRYKWSIKHRQNELPNRRSTRRFDDGERYTSSNDAVIKRDVRSVDITLGGGSK